MAKLNLSLNDVTIQTGSGNGFSPVPSGKYTVKVSGTQIKENKAQTGSYMIVDFVVTKGDFKDSVISELYNIVNPSQETVRIATEQVATITWATNAPTIIVNDKKTLHDSDDLVGWDEFDIKTELVDDGQYKKNKIKAILCTRSLDEECRVKVVEPTLAKKAAPWKK